MGMIVYREFLVVVASICHNGRIGSYVNTTYDLGGEVV